MKEFFSDLFELFHSVGYPLSFPKGKSEESIGAELEDGSGIISFDIHPNVFNHEYSNRLRIAVEYNYDFKNKELSTNVLFCGKFANELLINHKECITLMQAIDDFLTKFKEIYCWHKEFDHVD